MKLIKPQGKDKFILVSDEEIKEGNWYYTEPYSNLSIRKCEDDKYDFTHCKKIIADIPELPSIDLSLLSEEDCKIIGWIDVEKLANNECIGNQAKRGFIKGFKAAQSLTDKMFSLEDMKRAFETGRNYQLTGEDNYNELIQSLQQTSWEVEVNELNQITKIL